MVVGRIRKTVIIVPTMATHVSAASVRNGERDQQQDDHDEHDAGEDDVDQSREDPRAQGRRGQVERDRLAGDEVVVVRVANSTVRGIASRRGRHSRHGTATAYIGGVDLDAYVLAHVHEWRRLEELTRRRRLTGAESDELVERYQQVATHLSVVRTSAPDASLVAYLSSILAKARTRSVGTRNASWRSVTGFFTERFRRRSTGCATGGWARWPSTCSSPG